MSSQIEVFVGPMFSGKSRDLITCLKRYAVAGNSIALCKPWLDTRTKREVRTRDGISIPAYVARSSIDLIKWSEGKRRSSPGDVVIGIDEAQFFDGRLPDVLGYISGELGIGTVVAGLPRDFRGEPFGPMPEVMAMAHILHALTAICTHQGRNGKTCGGVATETYRSIDGRPCSYTDPVVVVGDKKEGYEARCLKHHFVRNRPKIVFDLVSNAGNRSD